MSRYLTLPLFCLALLFSACQTVNELPGLANARKHDGQMVYQTSHTSVVGDVILRTQPSGDYDLIFSKGGAEVLQIQAHGDQLVATGLLARNGWTGPVAPVDRVPSCSRVGRYSNRLSLTSTRTRHQPRAARFGTPLSNGKGINSLGPR